MDDFYAVERRFRHSGVRMDAQRQADRKWNLYDLQDRLRMKGWLVPAYPMPVDLTQVTVQRIVVRNGFSHDMAEAFIKDLKSCVKYLDGLRSPMPSEARASGFHH